MKVVALEELFSIQPLLFVFMEIMLLNIKSGMVGTIIEA